MLGMPYTRLPGKGHSSHLMVLRAGQHAIVFPSFLAPHLWENFVLFHLLYTFSTLLPLWIIQL